MNSVLEGLRKADNYKRTKNGGVALKSTLNAVYDLFALGGAYRERSDEDCIFLFKKAYEENPELALKCLFYLADCRGGQGERRFFRVCYNWLAKNDMHAALYNMDMIPTFRRWDDLLYAFKGVDYFDRVLTFVEEQLAIDLQSKTPSLLAKWLPSENASSPETIAMAGEVRKYLGLTHKQYRKILSELRSRINIVEKLMSENRWDEIEFDKIPSKAGLIYKNAFARRDIIARKYEEFAKDNTTKVNADTLYPYEIVSKVINSGRNYNGLSLSDTDRLMLEKYWNNLPDYFEGKPSNMLCVVDTSGSMCGDRASAPINVAISLGMYAAERAGGPFKDHYISFSSRPQLIEVGGVDFADKVYRIYGTNLCDNTDLTKTFDMLLKIADDPATKEEDIPETIVVISDMEIDYMSEEEWDEDATVTEMEKVRKKWAEHGHKMPRLVYWNVDARQNTILDKGPAVSFVSGMSPTIFNTIISGKNGVDLMLSILNSERYACIGPCWRPC